MKVHRRKIILGIAGFLIFRISETKAQTGVASWYGKKFAGKRTASGKRFNPKEFTAAHRTYKFGTKLRIINLQNGKTVIVTITDRGPYSRGRIIDLSKAAARKIGMLKTGTTRVKIERIRND